MLRQTQSVTVVITPLLNTDVVPAEDLQTLSTHPGVSVPTLTHLKGIPGALALIGFASPSGLHEPSAAIS